MVASTSIVWSKIHFYDLRRIKLCILVFSTVSVHNSPMIDNTFTRKSTSGILLKVISNEFDGLEIHLQLLPVICVFCARGSLSILIYKYCKNKIEIKD